MGAPLVPAERLRAHCEAVLRALSVPDDQARIVADSLVDADLRGVESHGANLVALYVRRLRDGHMQPHANIRVLRDAGSTLQLDGGMGPGQVAGVYAIDQAVERAREHGVASVSVRESTHLGALGYFTRRAAERGAFAMAFQNGPTLVPPHGGITPLFSTNPFSYAVPAGEEAPIVCDMAATQIAANKLVLARKRGDASIPEGWASDERGVPTTDPERASIERLQWAGGHKGFGLALLVEILSGVLTNSSFGLTDVSDAPPMPSSARVAKGYLFLALDVTRFLPLDVFRARVDALIRDIVDSEPAEGVERVLVPGLRGHELREARLRDGIPLSAELIAELDRFGEELEVGALLHA